MLLILIIVYLYFMTVEWLTTTYAARHHEAKVSAALLSGTYAWMFWGAVAALVLACGALLLPNLPAPANVRLPAYRPRYAQVTGAAAVAIFVVLLTQVIPVTRQVGLAPTSTLTRWLPWVLSVLLVLFAISILPLVRRNIIASTVLSGVLVNVAAISKRYLIAVPSQTHGTLLPYPTASYSPTWVEYSIILGLFALGILLYVLFIKVFPIMEVTEPVGGDMFEGDRS